MQLEVGKVYWVGPKELMLLGINFAEPKSNEVVIGRVKVTDDDLEVDLVYSEYERAYRKNEG